MRARGRLRRARCGARMRCSRTCSSVPLEPLPPAPSPRLAPPWRPPLAPRAALSGVLCARALWPPPAPRDRLTVLRDRGEGSGEDWRRAVDSELEALRESRGRPPPHPRTKWTRRVPHPVLIGHAASLTPY